MSKIIDRDRSEDCESPEVLTVLGINSKCVDLSWPYDNKTTVYWPTGSEGLKGFNHCVDCTAPSTPPDEHYAAGTFTTAEHGGTHVDGNLLLLLALTGYALLITATLIMDSDRQ
jgi:hypothetical protein